MDRASEQKAVDDLFDDVLKNAPPTLARKWEGRDKIAEGSICAQFVLAWRQHPEILSNCTPSVITDRGIEPLLKYCHTLYGEDLERMSGIHKITAVMTVSGGNIMEYDKEKSEALRRENLLQEIIQRLKPGNGESWDILKVCARYVDTLRLQGEDPLAIMPETIKRLCMEPLLADYVAMHPDALRDACAWEASPMPPVAVDQETDQAVAALRGQAVTVTSGELDATMLVMETRGALHHSQFIETVSRTSMLAKLAQVKASKAYKGAHVRDSDGNVVTIKTWDDYCKALGMSRRTVDEDLANLAAFGDNLLKMQDALGIGYRDLRKLRANLAALPEADQQQIRAEIEKAQDRDDLLAAMDEMGVRNARLAAEKKELEKQLATNDRLLKEAREKEYATRQKMEKAINPACQNDEEKAAELQMESQRAMISGKCVAFENAGTALAAAFGRMLSDDGRGRLTDAQLDELVAWANERLGLAVAKVAESLLASGADVDMAAAMQAIDLTGANNAEA